MILAGFWLDRLSLGTGTALLSGIRWLVAFGWLTSLALVWRAQAGTRLPVRWLGLLALAVAWF